MSELYNMIGLLGLSFLFSYIAFKLDEKHSVLKVFSLIASMLIMLLISKEVYINQDYCEIVLKNTTLSNGNFTDYEYQRVCFTNSHTTGLTLFKLLNYFFRILQWYIYFFMFWMLLDMFGFNPVEKIKGWLRK